MSGDPQQGRRRRGRPPKLTAEQRDEIQQRYQNTPITRVELAAEYEVSRRTISTALRGIRKAPGLRRPSRAKVTPYWASQVRGRFSRGDSRVEMAQIFGLSRMQVYRIARGENWPEKSG